MQAAMQHHARCAGICSTSGRSAVTPVRPLCSSRPHMHARASRAAAGPSADPQQPVPVVVPVVLPPPSAGSQYTRRWRSPVSDASPPGGNGGRGTGSRGRKSTRDWGRGPAGSSLLLALLFRVRMLLVYGVWITLMYGVVHTTVGLVTGAGHTVAGVLTWALHGQRGQQRSANAAAAVEGAAGVATASARNAEAAAAAAAVSAAEEAWQQAAGGTQSTAGTSAAGVFQQAAGNDGFCGGSEPGKPLLTGSGAAFGAAAMPHSAQQGSRGGLLRDVLTIYVLVMGSVLFFASN